MTKGVSKSEQRARCIFNFGKKVKKAPFQAALKKCKGAGPKTRRNATRVSKRPGRAEQKERCFFNAAREVKSFDAAVQRCATAGRKAKKGNPKRKASSTRKSNRKGGRKEVRLQMRTKHYGRNPHPYDDFAHA